MDGTVTRRCEGSESMSPQPTSVPSRPSTVRVLVADADADARASYAAVLKSEGWDVLSAADGREALVSAFTHRPSLVISELQLPVFDGYQLCTVLRGDIKTRGVPILFVTAETDRSELDRANHAGADAVLVKPVSPDTLLKEIRRLLERPPQNQKDAELAADQTQALTTTPPKQPPTVVCPTCDRPLKYEHSFVGGVSPPSEQWDQYTCASCGGFEFRHRTKRLRALARD